MADGGKRRNTFSKSERIYLNKDVERLFSTRKSLHVYPFKVIYTLCERLEEPCMVLVSVSKKRVRHAVDRNRVKRLFREAYRTHKHDLIQMMQEIPAEQTLLIGFIYVGNRVHSTHRISTAVVETLSQLSTQIATDGTA